MPSAISAAGFSTAGGAAPSWAKRRGQRQGEQGGDGERQAHGFPLRAIRFVMRRDLAFARSLRQLQGDEPGSGRLITQYGVLPYRVDARGEARNPAHHLARSAGAGWFPRAIRSRFFLNYESAAREAFEEAGVEGRIATVPIGTYPLRKEAARGRARRRRSSTSIRCW